MELAEGRVSGICVDFCYNTVSIIVAAEFVRPEIRRNTSRDLIRSFITCSGQILLW
jgi:hypothetical protein